jgi:uncharacterized membrane protein
MFESVFEFLFKFRPSVFAQGDLRVGLSGAGILALVTGGVAIASAVVYYARSGGIPRPIDRLVLAALRTAALAIAVFCLLRPVLVLKAAVPQQNVIGVLLDDSRSMRIADRDGETRGRWVQRTFGVESPVLRALQDRFVVRVFRFDRGVDRAAGAAALAFEGTETRVGDALARAREELAGLPVAGLVVATDGADTGETALTEALLALRADGVPVFTVGVGREVLSRDVQVSRVSSPRTVLEGTSLAVDVVVTASGYGGTKVPLNVETDGRIVGREEITLPRDGEPATVRVRFTASEAGARVFRFRIPGQDGEMVAENNVREALIDVEDRRDKILYFEGEPRFEVKFIRRAVSDDKNLQLVVLQRTADNKYLRLDVDHGEELAAGFPKTRDELFAYRALILGSVEAAAFTGDQLRMIAEFVDRRGGGLLVLGGARSLAEGGYAGTAIADVLPVVLEAPSGQNPAPALARLNVRSTRAGAAHSALQVAATEAQSAARWPELPQVTSVNALRQAKPGAAVLLTGADEARRERIVLASQRYGRGKSAVLSIQDSWQWQMHEQMSVEDQTHENLWKQLLRWLTDGVPQPVTTRATPDRAEPGQRVTIVAEVADASYVEVNNARATATVTSPAGVAVEVPLQWSGERNGEYTGTFVPTESGVYTTRVQAARGEQSLGADEDHMRAAPGDAEYFDPAMRRPLLERIAEETGGRFYDEGRVSALPEDVKYSGRGVTVVEERDLWDMPVLLFLFVGALAGEWSYRRARGLA